MPFFKSTGDPITSQKRLDRAVVDSLKAEIRHMQAMLQNSRNESNRALQSANESAQALEIAKQEHERDLATRQEVINNLEKALEQTRHELADARSHFEAVRIALAHSKRAQNQLQSQLESTRLELDQANASLGVGQHRSGGKHHRMFSFRNLFNWCRPPRMSEENHSSESLVDLDWEGFFGVLYNGSALGNNDPEQIREVFNSTLTAPGLEASVAPELARLQRCTMELQAASGVALERQRANQLLSRSTAAFDTKNTRSSARNLQLLVALYDIDHAQALSTKLAQVVLDSAPPTSFSCNICWVDYRREQGSRIEGCGHTVCNTCLEKHVEARLIEGTWPVHCPICVADSGTRNAAVLSRFLVDELNLSERHRALWTNYEVAQFIAHMNCIQCKADFYLELEDLGQKKLITCPQDKCGITWCKQCDEVVKPTANHNCEEKAFQSLAKDRRWKKCPNNKCGIMCERISGCDNMTCRCGMYFCYVCGKPKANHNSCNPN